MATEEEFAGEYSETPTKKSSQPRKKIIKKEVSGEVIYGKEEVAEAIVSISKNIAKGVIDTTSPLLPLDGKDEDGDVVLVLDPFVRKIIEDSPFTDTVMRDLIKAKAVVNPTQYLSDRATKIREINLVIANTLNSYAADLAVRKPNITKNQKKALIQKKFAQLIDESYTELNMDYPITNLAESIQQAMNTSNIAPKSTIAQSNARRGRRKK